ncbi:MAG: hypothetical protein JNL70_01105 [Saprospiraceae bacterium]|nr:hypothetical protein [Saprospiraceae bacterium]
MHAQTVTQSWAALASGASPYGIVVDLASLYFPCNNRLIPLDKIFIRQE